MQIYRYADIQIHRCTESRPALGFGLWPAAPSSPPADLSMTFFAAVLRILRPRSTASTGSAGCGPNNPLRRSFVAYFLPGFLAPGAYGVEHCSVGDKRASSPAGKKQRGRGQESNPAKPVPKLLARSSDKQVENP